MLLKKIFDLFFSLLLSLFLAPLLIILAIIIKINLGSPILFRQKRPGEGEAIFTMYKFRTMNNGKDKKGNLLPDDKRLTKFGILLRKTSLDELPELFNIFKGEMSFVGPRPLLVKYLERYNDEQKRRHEVKPGLTGWAQVNGRNAISWEEKFKLDIWYVDNWSFWLDIKIIILTFAKVFKREGISQEGQATMEEFCGENHRNKRREDEKTR